jgi:hypothetical protein
MAEHKVEISSKAIEKALDIAKDFLDKLIMPSVEETGLLLRDKVTFWRTKNQIQILNKAKLHCEKHNVATKTISLKVLCPLLDNASLEDDEIMQDKWAILIANMVNSELNIENHVFPYILSQISKDEFLFLESVYQSKQRRVEKLSEQLKSMLEERPEREKQLRESIADISATIKSDPIAANKEGFYSQKANMERALSQLASEAKSLQRKISLPESIPDTDIKPFELANLVRLGLAKEIHEPYADSQTLEIPNYPEKDYLHVEIDIDVSSNDSHILTELGDLFMAACTERTTSKPG